MATRGRNDVDAVMGHFAEDLALYAGPYAPVAGRDAIRKTMEAYFKSRKMCRPRNLSRSGICQGN